MLEQARTKLEDFAKTQPNHPLARDALVQIARMLVERGHLALLLADESQDATARRPPSRPRRGARSARPRPLSTRRPSSLEQARRAFPISLPKGDPRIEERDKVYAAMLDAMLQKAVSDYELAQTYPAGSKERTDNLNEALKQFEELYKAHRTQMAGLTAQMWQAKCYEEQGKIGEAIGIYKSLLEQTDPRLRPLQRYVGYFYIVALAKRKEYALAADEADAWLQTYSTREELRSQEGPGRAPRAGQEHRRPDGRSATPVDAASGRQAVKRDHRRGLAGRPLRLALQERGAGPAQEVQADAAAARAEEIARLTYEDAVGQADEAIASHEWDRAIVLLKAAVRKADPRRDIDKANRARYNLAFCYYMNKQFYEANVLAEHLARRYPQGGLSPKAAEIGMQALADAYNTYTEIDRVSDLERLIDLAKYTAETWPDREQGDDAQMNLGQIYQGRGQYDQAIAEFAAVRERSPK